MKAKAVIYFLILCRQLLSLERYRRKKGVEVKVHCRTWAFYGMFWKIDYMVYLESGGWRFCWTRGRPMGPAWNTSKLTIYAPKIYTGPCVMFLMRAYTLRGEVGGGGGTGNREFFGPLEMARSDRWVPIGAQKTPHPELIRNHQQSVRCIKGRSGS